MVHCDVLEKGWDVEDIVRVPSASWECCWLVSLGVR